jgi:hypothetical protein
MFAPQPLLHFSDAERPLGERLLKLAAETDRIEGYPQAHASAIARLAEKLGQRLGLRGVDLSALKFAALAHDLGERAMKRDYLLRPGSLTWEEQLDLWRHPIIGEQAAADAKLPRQAQLLIRWHHEWWNGHGYPDGLAGADIPLGARILRVVDTYCALLSDRPHRAKSEPESVEQFIADQAGIEADPRVVQEFLAWLAEERLVVEPEATVDFQPAELLAEPLAETAEATETPAPAFVSVWDSARQAAEPESLGWQERTARAAERWPNTRDFPEGVETNPFPPEPAKTAETVTEVVPLDGTPEPAKVAITAEEAAVPTNADPVVELESVAAPADTPPVPSESTDSAVAEQRMIQVLEEPAPAEEQPTRKEAETL